MPMNFFVNFIGFTAYCGGDTLRLHNSHRNRSTGFIFMVWPINERSNTLEGIGIDLKRVNQDKTRPIMILDTINHQQ